MNYILVEVQGRWGTPQWPLFDPILYYNIQHWIYNIDWSSPGPPSRVDRFQEFLTRDPGSWIQMLNIGICIDINVYLRGTLWPNYNTYRSGIFTIVIYIMQGYYMYNFSHFYWKIKNLLKNDLYNSKPTGQVGYPIVTSVWPHYILSYTALNI